MREVSNYGLIGRWGGMLNGNRRLKMLFFPTVFVILLFIQGCGLGFIIYGNENVTMPNPVISKDKGRVAKNMIADQPVTSKELLAHWGKPDRSEQIFSNKEKWTYNVGLSWYGVALIPIIMIPLGIPVGHDHVCLTVENGNVTSAYFEFAVAVSGAGWIYLGHGTCNGSISRCIEIERGNLLHKFIEYQKANLLHAPLGDGDPRLH
jgi:hypothetical protein